MATVHSDNDDFAETIAISTCHDVTVRFSSGKEMDVLLGMPHTYHKLLSLLLY